MKRLIALILAVFTVLLLASCGGSANEPETTGDATASDPADTTDDVTTSENGSSQEPSFGEGLDEKGFLIGIRASDYVTLPDYKNAAIPADVVDSSEQIESQLKMIAENYTYEVKSPDPERKAENGDKVNIDYVGSVDGVEFERGSTKGAGTDVVIGETKYIPGFLDQVIGHKAGDNFDINVTFPDPYEKNPDLAGKDAVFNCTVNYIYDEVIPEMTDELIASHSDELRGFTTVKELTDDIEKYYFDMLGGEYVQDYLISNSQFTEVPDAAYEYQVNSMIQYYTLMAAQYGVTFDQAVGTSVEAFKEENKETNMRMAKLMLAVQAIVETNDEINIDEEVLKAYFLENNGSEDYSSFVEQYGMPYIMNVVTNDVVIQYILDHATVVSSEPVTE